MSKWIRVKKEVVKELKKLNKRQRKLVILLTGIIGVAIITGVILVMASHNGWELDNSAARGGRDGMTQEEILEELQQMTDDSRFRVKINQYPSMKKDTGATNVLIQNSVENNMNKKVIYYDENGEVVYETYELYPGDDILSAVIPGEWKEGQYNLTAVIIAIDKELDEELIVTEMDIVLTVK